MKAEFTLGLSKRAIREAEEAAEAATLAVPNYLKVKANQPEPLGSTHVLFLPPKGD